MENCLVTKLKANVQNDELLKMDELRWDIKAGITSNFLISNVNPVATTLTIIKGTGEFLNMSDVSLGTSIVLDKDNVNYAKVKATTDIEVQCFISDLNFKIIDFMGNNGLRKECHFIALHQSALESILCISYIGDAITVNNITDAVITPSNIKEIQLQSSCAYGEITDFTPYTGLTVLRVGAGFVRSNITGSLDTLCESIANSKQEGSTLVFTGNGIVTYKSNGDGTGDDVVIADGETKIITFANGSYTIA